MNICSASRTGRQAFVILCTAKDLRLSSADGVNTATCVRYDIPIRRSFGSLLSLNTKADPPPAAAERG
jgi:hypothetical protein